MEHIFVNALTGEETVVPFTPDEIAAATAPPDKAALVAFTVEHRRALTNGSAVLSVGNDRLVPIWIDPESRGSLLGLVVAAGLNPAITTSWKGSDGNFYDLDATEIATLSLNALEFIQSCFDTEKSVLVAIEAETITTFDDVVAAGWPS